VFIAAYLVLFEKRIPGGVTLAAMAGALVGCFFVVGAYDPNVFTTDIAGIVSGLLSGITFAWWSVHGEYGMQRYNSWTVLFYATAIGAVEWNVIHPPLEAFCHNYSPVEWLWIVHIGILGTLMPFGLYLMGIKHIQATRAAITATLEPITAGVIAWVFLNEAMDILQLAGALLVIASIVMLQMKPVRDVDAS
jgi:DME family drug/metabolite transporter